MKRSIVFLLSACALCFASENAIARGGGHSRPAAHAPAHRPGPSHRPGPVHHSPPRHHHSRTFVGLSFGFPVWPYPAYSSYYPSPYEPYYPYPSSQTVIVQSAPAPTQYIEKDNSGADNSSNKTDQFWYYCRDPKGYYPYVEKCNTEWQKVIPFPQDEAK